MLCIINLQINLAHCLWIYLLVSFFGKRFRLGRWLTVDSIVLLFFILSLIRDVSNIITRDVSTKTSFRSFVLYFVKKKRKKQEKWNRLLKMYIVFRTLGAFHSVENFGNCAKKSKERTVSVRSDRNIWDHLWRWSILTDPVISVRWDQNVPFHLTILCFQEVNN